MKYNDGDGEIKDTGGTEKYSPLSTNVIQNHREKKQNNTTLQW